MKKIIFKTLTNVGPIEIFLYIYYDSGKDLKIALPPLIIATLVVTILVWLFEKKVAFLPLLGGFFIALFGGLTIYFDNPIFIYIKPTILNILIGLTLLFGGYFTKEPMIKKILGSKVPMRKRGWEIFNTRWILLVFGLALLNEIVWRTQTEEFWVNLKVWGSPIISAIFSVFQIKLIKKYRTKKNRTIGFEASYK
jgi:intracellular septation protein